MKDKISLENKELITSDDLLGKDVIDANGEFLGIVETVYIHPLNFDFVGISIDKGFLKKGLVVGKEYIQKVTNYALFLNIRPAYNIKGMSVFDISGEKIGKIKEIKLKENKNKIDKIMVSYSLLKRNIEINSSFIKSIGENVFLNIEKKEILNLSRK